MKKFLKKIFGPSKREIWEQLSKEINAQYVDHGLFTVPKVIAKHRDWEICLDTYTTDDTTYTRLSSPYVSKHGFQFRIYRHGLFSNVGKLLGMQDIEVGYDAFDDDFIIQGNDPYKVELMFDNESIRELLQDIPKVDLRIQDGSAWFEKRQVIKPVDNLHFQVMGTIKDIEQLKVLFELFAEMLDQLCEIGAAYDEKPTNKYP
ncbi:MAG: hypothetical protein AB8B69_14710 [Chitinophagales bacterium]